MSPIGLRDFFRVPNLRHSIDGPYQSSVVAVFTFYEMLNIKLILLNS